MEKLESRLMFLVLLLHISQFIVLGFFFQGLVGILRKNGVLLEKLSFIVYTWTIYDIQIFMGAVFR